MTETKTEYKPLQKKFIELLRTGDHKDPLSLVELRITKLGFATKCSRCGGTGDYARYGTCFRCGGRAYDKIRLTKALYEEVSNAVTAGKLDEYLADVKVRQQLDKAEDNLFKLMNDNQLSKDYSAIYDADRFGKGLRPIYKLRAEQTKVYEDYKKLRAKYRGREWKEKIKKMQKENYNEVHFIYDTNEILLDMYEEAKEKLIEINEEYEAFREIFKTIL